MKRVLFVFISIFFFASVNSQNLTESSFLSQLPKTTDDLQNYQFDYALENLESHLYSAPFNFATTISSFDGTAIFPFEHNCPVKEIECYQFNKRDNKDMLCYAVKGTFLTNGQIADFSGKACYKEQYWYTDKIYSEIQGADLRLIPCLPNPYITYIVPTRNEKGLITKVGNDLVYSYDLQDRVIEINDTKGNYSCHYKYYNKTKKISNIKIYISKRIRGEVDYIYTNDNLIELIGKLFNETGYEGSIEKEYHKTYTYDSKGGISGIKYVTKTSPNSELRHEYTFNNTYDGAGRIVTSSVTMNRSSRTGSYGGGLKEPMTFTRTYTYDNQGNWIRIDDGQGHYVSRKIMYKASMESKVYDANHVYDDEEVDVHATMGNSLKKKAYNGKFFPMPPAVLENADFASNTVVSVDFIVEKDGSISNFEARGERWLADEAKKVLTGFTWISATKDNKPVRSNISLAWSFIKEEERILLKIIKDLTFTDKEEAAYEKEKVNIELKNNQKYLEQLEKDVRNGDWQAKKKLAKDYYYGEHGVRNLDRALDLYLDLALRSNYKEYKDIIINNKQRVLSNNNYCHRLAKDVNPTLVSDDDWDVLRLYAAAKCGNKEVYTNQFRISKEHKLKSYYVWLIWGATHNDYQAMYELAELYLDTSSGMFDSQKGIDLLIKAADAGHPDARYSLGLKYKYGTYVEKDKKKAKLYLK